jgi:AcrR family transcriptional regulator
MSRKTGPGSPLTAMPARVSASSRQPAVRRETTRVPPPHASDQRPSLQGGIPAQQRGLRAQGRETVRRLLDAGLQEFDETGFEATRVEDIVRRAKTSHGTFYLYFANKDDLFRTLLRDALHDMAIVTDEFPVVTDNEHGRAALRQWVERFGETYAAHAIVIRILSQAEIVGETVYADGLQLMFRLSEAMTQGMTAASRARRACEPDAQPEAEGHAELSALACLMMLERVNYLLSADVQLPRDEMNDRVASIIFAAFRHPAHADTPDPDLGSGVSSMSTDITAGERWDSNPRHPGPQPGALTS